MRKKKTGKNDKIKQEIIDRVFDESKTIKKTEEERAEEEIEIESLSEVSGLPQKRISEITKSVKAKYALRKDKVKIRIWKGIILLIVGFFLFSIGNSVINSIKTKKEKQNRLSYEELLSAAGSGNMERAKELTAEGIGLENEAFPNDSPLLRAAVTNNVDMVKYLIANGADVLKKDSSGKNALELSNQKTFLEVQMTLGEAVAMLAQEGSPVRTLWGEGISYSEHSYRKYLEENNIRVIELFCLADNGMFSHDWDSSSLGLTISKRHTDMLLYILKNGKNLKDTDKSNALFAAAKLNDVTSMEALLSSGADINHKHSDYFTPLVTAIVSGKKSVEYLLSKGADPNLNAGDEEYLPLFIALQTKIGNYVPETRRYQIVKALIDAGVNVNTKGYQDRLALEVAWGREFYTISKLLKENGSAIPFTESAFRYLVMENDFKNVRQFLQKGIDPDLTGFDFYDKDMTALMYTAKNDLPETAEILLKEGADPAKKTGAGHNAYYYADRYSRNNKVKELLVQYGYSPL